MFDKYANEDFDKALTKAFWRKVRNWFTGESNQLIAYDEVKKRIPYRGQHDRGLMQVPVENIVGSVGRYLDFDRAFLPTQSHTRDRWISIDIAHYQDIILPPVELFKIGEIYFVKDGNHRISVARERGQTFVDAYVIEVDVPGPVHSEEDLDKLVLAEELETFYETTHLDKLRPNANFDTKISGQYQKLIEHIRAHQWYLGERKGTEIPFETAIVSWYDNIYQPVVDILHENKLARNFPEYSELDLYLWILEFQWHLREAHESQLVNAQEAAISKIDPSAQAVRKLVSTLIRTAILDEISSRLEYAKFMDQTGLLSLRPEAKMEATVPGAYEQLLEHIASHKYFLGERLNREIGYEEALLSWYDTVYLPLVEIIRDQKILSLFPDRKETDLYLWIIQRQWYLREEKGQEKSLSDAAEEFAEENIPPLKKVIKAILPTDNTEEKVPEAEEITDDEVDGSSSSE